MSDTIKRRVVRIEIGGVHDAKMFLDDGSELIGLTALSASLTDCDALAKWTAEGLTMPDPFKPKGAA